MVRSTSSRNLLNRPAASPAAASFLKIESRFSSASFTAAKVNGVRCQRLRERVAVVEPLNLGSPAQLG